MNLVGRLVGDRLFERLHPLHAQAVRQKLRDGQFAPQPGRSPVAPSEWLECCVHLVQIPAPCLRPQKPPAPEPATSVVKPRSQLSRNRAIPRTASPNR